MSRCTRARSGRVPQEAFESVTPSATIAGSLPSLMLSGTRARLLAAGRFSNLVGKLGLVARQVARGDQATPPITAMGIAAAATRASRLQGISHADRFSLKHRP